MYEVCVYGGGGGVGGLLGLALVVQKEGGVIRGRWGGSGGAP